MEPGQDRQDQQVKIMAKPVRRRQGTRRQGTVLCLLFSDEGDRGRFSVSLSERKETENRPLSPIDQSPPVLFPFRPDNTANSTAAPAASVKASHSAAWLSSPVDGPLEESELLAISLSDET